MEKNEEILIGQVVRSRAGRDKNRIFLVLEVVDSENVLIVDGDLRTLDKPKKKKIKHLIIYNTVLPEIKYKADNNLKIDNSYIRKLLEPFNRTFLKN